MRTDAVLYRYEPLTGELGILQIPYAAPEPCPIDPEALRVRAQADGRTLLVVHDWTWAEAVLPPADQVEPAGAKCTPQAGPLAVRFEVPETGQERSVWYEAAVADRDPHGRVTVRDGATGHVVALFKKPLEALSRPLSAQLAR